MSQLSLTTRFFNYNQHLFNMLFRKIIATILGIAEFVFGVTLLIFWSLAYPLLRLRYEKTKQYKHLPSLVIFRAFIWSGNLFKFDYFKK